MEQDSYAKGKYDATAGPDSQIIDRVSELADKYGVSVPQLCIRYDWQLNCVVLPKSANPIHMKSNAEIDFVISDDDMEKLKKFTPVDYGKAGIFPVFGGKM